MTIFFTSDTHFGHEAVIPSCERPFGSAAEMDDAMIARWNAVVGARDTIYHLGDVCHAADRGCDRYLERLNGEIHLVQGNHDEETVKHHAQRFASVSLIKQIRVGRQMIVLCHYPMREWNGCYLGSWHLHGHVHGRLNHAVLGHSMDVGVDCNDFRPWAFEEVADILSERETPFTDRGALPVRRTIRAPSSPGNP